MKRPFRTPSIAALYLLSAALVALMLSGCSDDMGSGSGENLPPDVWLVTAPPEGDSTSYRVHMEWGGSDPDGRIAYYEYSITDNGRGAFLPVDTTGPDNWFRVDNEESTFVFSADVLADSSTDDLVSRFQRSHTFFIRAVDDAGLPSPEPAYRSFTAWTLSPDARIVFPRYSGTTPSFLRHISTYRWRATDYVNSLTDVIEPDSVRWILHEVQNSDFAGGIDFIRRNPHSDEWHPWVDYRAPDDAGKFWTTPPIDVGAYVFAVQAKDEAGAVTPVFDERYNVRRVRVRTQETGPLLTLANEYIGFVRTSIVNTPIVIVDLPAGLPVSFRWVASAESYGGTVTGYRYGWDISDLTDPGEWETDFIPFEASYASSPPREFQFGSHIFDVEVIDDTGFKSRVEIKVNFIPFTMTSDLLLVDDFYLQSDGIVQSGGAVPSDAEHDAFWQTVLADAAGFSFQDDAVTVSSGNDLSIARIATYKTIIWDAYGGYNIGPSGLRPKLYDLVRFYPEDPVFGPALRVQPNLLALFQKVGGRLMVCGHQPMTQVINHNFAWDALRFPFVFKYELLGDQDGSYPDQIQEGDFVGDESYAWRDACLNVLDISYPGISNLRTSENGCRVDRTHGTDPAANGLREALPLVAGFPALALRNEVAMATRYYAPDRRGLNAELYNPPYFASCSFAEIEPARGCFEPVYGHGCLDTDSPLYNAPVAFWSSVYADVIPDAGGPPARSFFMGVEPYYFEPARVKEMMDVILFQEWGLARAADPAKNAR